MQQWQLANLGEIRNTVLLHLCYLSSKQGHVERATSFAKADNWKAAVEVLGKMPEVTVPQARLEEEAFCEMFGLFAARRLA